MGVNLNPNGFKSALTTVHSRDAQRPVYYREIQTHAMPCHASSTYHEWILLSRLVNEMRLLKKKILAQASTIRSETSNAALRLCLIKNYGFHNSIEDKKVLLCPTGNTNQFECNYLLFIWFYCRDGCSNIWMRR